MKKVKNGIDKKKKEWYHSNTVEKTENKTKYFEKRNKKF